MENGAKVAVENGAKTARPVADQSTAELVQHASEQFSRLVRDELVLARTELVEKGRHAGKGAGLFGGGGLITLYGIGVLILAVVYGLAEAVPLWLAALIVGVALLVLAGVLALLGRQEFRQAMPASPEEARQSVQADVAAVSTAVRERGKP